MRTRQIHRDFWASEDVAKVGYFERLLFAGLWGMADREGLVLNRPARIRAEIFPYDDITHAKIAQAIAKLCDASLLQILTNGDDVITCIYIPNFLKYQHIHPNEAKSILICKYIPGNYAECKPASTSTSTSASASASRPMPDAGTPSAPGPTPGPNTVATWSQEADECTRQLADAMMANDPHARIPDRSSKAWQTWCTDIDKINRIDGRPWPEIQAVIRWSQKDEFWRANILSPSKLRKQFAQLLHQSKRGRQTTSNAETYERMMADGLIKRDS